MGDSFYIQDDDARFISTDWTRGPWDPGAQHGGPPAALLGRAVERATSDDMAVARIAFDLLRPVPVAPLDLQVEVVRGGKKVSLTEAALSHEGQVVMRATAWSIRRADLDIPAPEGAQPPPIPEGTTGETFTTAWNDTSYLTAMEWRLASGSFLELGPATAWMRMRMPLVDGEPIDPLSRVLAAADSGSGISGALPFDKWLFINPDLTVHLFAYPEGEWVCLESQTTPHPNGTGLASTTIYDASGRIGTGAQSLYLAPR